MRDTIPDGVEPPARAGLPEPLRSAADADTATAPLIEACDMNLGPRQRAKRLYVGIAGGVASLAVAIAILATGAARPWRLSIAGFVVASVIGFVQYRAKT